MSTNQATEQIKQYLSDKKVEELLTGILEAICVSRPDDVSSFIIDYLENKNQSQGLKFDSSEEEEEVNDPEYQQALESFQKDKFHLTKEDEKKIASKKKESLSFVSPDDRRQSQDLIQAQKEKQQEQQMITEIDTESSEKIRRRYSVSTIRRKAFSSESINMVDVQNFKPPKIAKTTEERARLEQSLSGNALFSHFEKDDCEIIYDAMFSCSFSKGDIIIKQGDKGDNFYLIDTGTCEVYVRFDKDNEEIVKVCRAGDTFGELALMYGTPRAATVKAATDCKLWAIDRMSYRKIIMGQTMNKRDLYEGFLKKVPILLSMDSYERLIIADALISQTFSAGELIIKQGDVGLSFFIIIEGEAQVWKTVDGKRVDLITLKKGDYFGELALLFNQPRAANITANTNMKTVSLDAQSFKLLLGPVDDILKRNTENYEYYMKKQM